MAEEISHAELKQELHAVLKTADLNVTSAKKIREQVEKKLNCSLVHRKKECDDIVMDYMNQQEAEENDAAEQAEFDKNDDDNDDDDDDDDGGSDSEEENKSNKKSSSIGGKTKKSSEKSGKKRSASSGKKNKWSSNASGSGSTSDDNDSDYEQPKKKKAKKKAGGAGVGGVKRQTGFTKALKLSPDLATLVGSDLMSRHEVVKRVWGIIKERQLADPSNKQFTICDDQLYTVMKVKRFRTFGMLKHLKPHFID